MKNIRKFTWKLSVFAGEIFNIPASILYKSIAGRYRPVSYPDGPRTARYRFIKNAYWDLNRRVFVMYVWLIELEDVCERLRPCKNGGNCSSRGGDEYECCCSVGWTGRHCDQPYFTPRPPNGPIKGKRMFVGESKVNLTVIMLTLTIQRTRNSANGKLMIVFLFFSPRNITKT